ncbi:hypothetical protein H2199_004087 [Coniosporium tulheliwenetii]|uniref:Uncharacterized protein n=1 Tax=Coniosporium tulheliwenetii TaxID=3383036 RepID=A0ACC2Z798_9PEZI|nr:hypothetical protein H2199_004087 [Cladosporium sp. JES 115]
MDTEDGSVFIKNLAYFVRTHEKALANALQLQRQAPRNASSPPSGSTTAATTTSSSASATFAAALSLPYLSFTSQNIKPVKLTLTPHHLFFLLSRFEELGIPVGPMNVRLENIHTDASPTNYVSFLSQAQRKKSRNSDRDSTHSVSSIRSVMSGMASLWSSFGLSNSAAKSEKQKAAIQEDLKYLYSAFTKIPCVRLAPDHKARLIAGYEEFPFDSAVPLFAFKNLSALEVYDVDFRQFYGWDRLADQLRGLTLKRAGVDDPADVLINIVLDDMDKRRRRSAKIPHPLRNPGPPPVRRSSKLRWRGNRLASLAGIERLLSLERLDLRDNKLTDPTELARLTGIPDMQEIFVSRNPFVKTHSSYRVTIFNLFRAAPGYSEDIIIDSTGPGYSERKQLIDRVPEVANVPVMKPPIEEDDVPVPVSEPSGLRTPTESPAPVDDPRKQLSSYRSRSEYARPLKTDIQEREQPGLSMIDTTVKSPSLDTPLKRPPLVSTEYSSNGDLYKKKIEALRNDFGNGWLSALGDGSWEGARTNSYSDGTYTPPGALRPTVPSVRSPSQGIVSGGRTLG